MNALAAVPSKIAHRHARCLPQQSILRDQQESPAAGLAIVDAPAGSIVSYATVAGQRKALDGDGRQQSLTPPPFSRSRKEPDLPIEQAFKRVRSAVNGATEATALPWESSSLTSDFSFFPGRRDRTPHHSGFCRISAAGVRAASRSVDVWKRELRRRSAREAYEIVIKDDTVEAYQAYLALFPGLPNSPRMRKCSIGGG